MVRAVEVITWDFHVQNVSLVRMRYEHIESCSSTVYSCVRTCVVGQQACAELCIPCVVREAWLYASCCSTRTSHAEQHVRVMLSSTCESWWVARESHAEQHVRVMLSSTWESCWAARDSHAEQHVRVMLSSTCERCRAAWRVFTVCYLAACASAAGQRRWCSRAARPTVCTGRWLCRGWTSRTTRREARRRTLRQSPRPGLGACVRPSLQTHAHHEQTMQPRKNKIQTKLFFIKKNSNIQITKISRVCKTARGNISIVTWCLCY